MVALNQTKVKKFLNSDQKIFKGIEKENLRSNPDGKISSNDFPKTLGNYATNKFFTLDYSEAHLELVTPVFEDSFELLSFLTDLHSYADRQIDNDILWNYSMPPKFKKQYIKLPTFGNTNKSKLAYLYRLGLRNRYGDKMQSTAGIHFNISFSDSVIESQQVNKNNFYLSICRNFLRLFPLALRLTGCSPVTHKSFLKGRSFVIDSINNSDFYLPRSTSLRVSRLGYYSEEQEEYFINFNSLAQYLQVVRHYINVPNKEFKKIPHTIKNLQQINNGTIQIESELYNHIRPKALLGDERQYLKLKSEGIEYLELRSIDLNPYSDIGISINDIHFWELFITLCALSESKEISDLESIVIKENIRRAAETGQDCLIIDSFDSKEGEVDIKSHTKSLLDELGKLAGKLNKDEFYSGMLDDFNYRNEKPLAKRFINNLSKQTLTEHVLNLSKKIENKISKHNMKIFQEEVELSKVRYDDILLREKISFEEFLMKYRREIT